MLRPLDAAIIVVYLAAVVVVGVAFRGRQTRAEDYFTASGGLGGMLGSCAVGLSIAATLFSGISFLAFPSVVYEHGCELLLSILILPLAWVILSYGFLPRYLAAAGEHPYSIIETRFGPHARTVAAAMFVLLRVGWMAALIYAPTVALLAAAGLPLAWFWPLVLTIGISSTVYTTLGGIRGVIITDAIQFLVIVGGIGLTLAYVLAQLPASLPEAIRDLYGSGHLGVDTSLDPTRGLTLWSVLIGGGVANLAAYLADQMSLQRYLTSADLKSARRSFAINLVGVALVMILLAAVGLALASWRQHTTDAGLPTNADRVFPYFVATHMPQGVAGLILAAILAATMSSMTSGINALASTITLDFRLRFGRPMPAAEQLRFARLVSLTVGVLATLAAGLIDALGSIFDIAQTLLGVFLGPLLAALVAAIWLPLLRGSAVVLGLLVGCAAGWATAFSPVASLWVAPAACLSTLVTAAAAHRLLTDTRSPHAQAIDATPSRPPAEG